MSRHALTAVQWRRIELLLPGRACMVGRWRRMTVCAWVLWFAFRYALAGHAGPLWHIDERAQTIHALGYKRRLGSGLCRPAQRWGEPLRSDRLSAVRHTSRLPRPEKRARRAVWAESRRCDDQDSAARQVARHAALLRAHRRAGQRLHANLAAARRSAARSLSAERGCDTDPILTIWRRGGYPTHPAACAW